MDKEKKKHAMASSSSDNNKLYKGVRKRKWGKWVSEIRLPNSRERIWLGSYDSPEKAARAFDCALYLLRGRHASFNFPDTPFNLDINVAAAAGNQSLTPQEIQEVAAKFGNQYQPQQQHHHHQQSSDIANFESHIGRESNFTTTAASSSNSTITMHEQCGATMQVEENGSMMNTIDWTFLNVLDNESNTYDNGGINLGGEYGLYSSELDKMHSGDFQFYSAPPTPPYEDNIADDPFSNQSSFLWSWNF